MTLIYHCYGGAHTSVTAANIHLGRLPRGHRPPVRAIMSQPYFDWLPTQEIGRPVCLGTDPAGRAIYCLGLGGGKTALRTAVLDFLQLLGAPVEQLYWADALSTANLPTRLGGFISKVLGLVWFGRPLVAFGVWLNYSRFVALVEQVEQQLNRLETHQVDQGTTNLTANVFHRATGRGKSP